MKINPGVKPIQPASVEARSTESSATKGTVAEQTPVSLSAYARRLNGAETALDTVAVDRSRVDGIKAALAAGEHTISSERIADTLLTAATKILHVAK